MNIILDLISYYKLDKNSSEDIPFLTGLIISNFLSSSIMFIVLIVSKNLSEFLLTNFDSYIYFSYTLLSSPIGSAIPDTMKAIYSFFPSY